jgi:hypothetical protein
VIFELKRGNFAAIYFSFGRREDILTTEDFIHSRANTTAAPAKALPAYDWRMVPAGEIEMDVDRNSSNSRRHHENAITIGQPGYLINNNNIHKDRWPAAPDQTAHADQDILATPAPGFTIGSNRGFSSTIAVPERVRRCRSMDRNMSSTTHDQPQQQAASNLSEDSSMDQQQHPEQDDGGEEFLPAGVDDRRSSQPYPPPPVPPNHHHHHHLLRSAASWDELDFTSQKRSTRKHAHFASSSSHHNNDDHDYDHGNGHHDDPTAITTTQHSSCKKQRGTPIRKSIFTPIKREDSVKPEEDDDDDERKDDMLDQQDHLQPWEISAVTSAAAGGGLLPRTAVKNKQKNKPNKRSFGTVTTATTSTSTTHFGDESTDHSVDSTGTTANFRFTSFPASLPRIHQQQHPQPSHHHHHTSAVVPTNISNLHGSYHMMEDVCDMNNTNNNNNNMNNHDYYCYSGDDHTAADDSTVASSMYGTPVARLTFASAMERTGTTAPCCTCH